VTWYREWFGEEYLELSAHRDAGEAAANVEGVLALLARERPRAVLDLACGTGRYTRVLRGREIPAVGLLELPDLPEPLLSIRSAGADGAFDTDTFTRGPYPPADAGRDIVWVDGYFASWPQS
jgi:trans-aconitate methyltransferase